jgi:hypothetical protein
VILLHADYLQKITRGGKPTAAETRLFGTGQAVYEPVHTLPVPEC